MVHDHVKNMGTHLSAMAATAMGTGTQLTDTGTHDLDVGTHVIGKN